MLDYENKKVFESRDSGDESAEKREDYHPPMLKIRAMKDLIQGGVESMDESNDGGMS